MEWWTLFFYLNSSQCFVSITPLFLWFDFTSQTIYNAPTEPALIAKSSILLDVKPWDDETDMAKLEECVRSIVLDGLVWGQCKCAVFLFWFWLNWFDNLVLRYLQHRFPTPGPGASTGLNILVFSLITTPDSNGLLIQSSLNWSVCIKAGKMLVCRTADSLGPGLWPSMWF